MAIVDGDIPDGTTPRLAQRYGVDSLAPRLANHVRSRGPCADFLNEVVVRGGRSCRDTCRHCAVWDRAHNYRASANHNLLPTVMPGKIVTPAPMKTLLPTVSGAYR